MCVGDKGETSAVGKVGRDGAALPPFLVDYYCVLAHSVVRNASEVQDALYGRLR